MVASALLIGLSQISAHRHSASAAPGSTSGLVGVSETAALLRGIPQHGFSLGSPTAPVRLVEYADPQCPYCALYARDVLPTLIRDYVRPGKVRLEFRGLWFLGADSGTALRTAVAAADQNRFWNVIELIYRNQGPENAWVNDDVLRAIVTGGGADAAEVFATRDSAAVGATVDGWARQAQADGIRGVPAFLVGRRGASPQPVAVRALTVPEFRAALEAALRK